MTTHIAFKRIRIRRWWRQRKHWWPVLELSDHKNLGQSRVVAVSSLRGTCCSSFTPTCFSARTPQNHGVQIFETLGARDVPG
jgi:hypothetical protein